MSAAVPLTFSCFLLDVLNHLSISMQCDRTDLKLVVALLEQFFKFRPTASDNTDNKKTLTTAHTSAKADVNPNITLT